MLVLEAKHIEKSYQGRLIFKLDEFQAYAEDRIGIVGLNGAGKSTLLKVLAGLVDPDSGQVLHHGQAAVISQLEEEGGYANPEMASKWQINRLKEEKMSGGERTRKKIAQAFEKKAHMLFADEPTSHLDLEGIERLEAELKGYEGAVFLISHDRELLDAVCTKILEVENGEIKQYDGHYSDYLEQKEHERAREWFEYEQYTKEKRRLAEAAVEKSQKVKKMRKTPKRMGISEARLHKRSVNGKKQKLEKNAKAIQSRIEQLEEKEKPKEQETVKFDIQAFSPIYGKTAIRLERLTKRYGEKTLFQELSCAIKPGMKVALVGRNGAGKSSLLEMMVSGEEGVQVAGSGKIGYFHQGMKTLIKEKTIYENVSEDSLYPEATIRTILARLLFKREDVLKPVSVLSGGERVKVQLAKLFLSDHNILLLDEPTNYLDLFTHEQLQMVLQAYPGTIVFATHDRRLMNQLADSLLVIEENGEWCFFEGTYEQYLEHLEHPEVPSDYSQLELMTMENELVEVISRLSFAVKEDEKEQLEQRYEILLQKIRKAKETT